MKKIILFSFLFFTTFIFSQNTYTVDNRTGSIADYDNLQTAIDEVSSGSILLVQGSTNSYGNINISKKIIIKGTGYFLDENPKTQSNSNSSKLGGVYFRAGSSGSIIIGLDIEPVVLYAEISNISILRNRIKYIKDENEKATNILVSNNFIYSSYKRYTTDRNKSIYLRGNSKVIGNVILSYVVGQNLEVTNNYLNVDYHNGGSYPTNCIFKNNIIGNSPNNIIISSANNTFYNNIIKSSSDFTGSNGNFYVSSIDGLFIENSDPKYTSDGKYSLKTGSVAIGAGVNGEDIGAFGGGYILSGIPDIPNIYEFTVPTTGYTNDGIQVKIKVKSNN